MPRQQSTPDAQIIDGEIRYGTALWRVNEILDNLPLDQEMADFYAGDLRDVCGIGDQTDKATIAIKGKVKGKPVGELLSLACADVRQLVAAARRGTKTEAVGPA